MKNKSKNTEVTDMKRFFAGIFVLGLAALFATPAFCQTPGKGGWQEPDFRMDCSGQSVARDYMKGEAWEAMTPEQREKWSTMWGTYLTETLPLRQQFSEKRLELQTTWAQPKVDEAKVEKLCDEMSELYIKRMKKRSKYLLKCRKEFGDLGWTCPSGK
jgi:Spy/CpxP family protein refolding chaperone